MKIIKIYSSWNQLKLKARAGHYNTEAHVRIWVQGRWELSEGGRGSKTEKATQNIHWRKMCPRPPVWSELGTGQAAGQWWLSMFTPGMCFKHWSNNHNYNTNSITTICPDKHGQVSPEAPGPRGWWWHHWSGQTLCLCLFRDGRQMSGSGWHHVTSEPGWPGGGAAGVTSGLSGMIWADVSRWHQAADNYTPRCFTQMNSICWSITQPQHAINFQSWRLVYRGHSIDTRADTLSISFLVSWIIAAFADTNDEV